MFVKIVCLFTLLAKVNYAQEVHTSRLLKVLSSKENNQWSEHGSMRSSLDTPEGLGGHKGHLPFLDIEDRIASFKDPPKIAKMEKNIVKRSIVVVGVNCPEGQVMPKGEKCSCRENSKCVLVVKIGDKTELREVML